MRSLLVKSSITLFILLALGSGLTLAATSSEPGMFLYPIKQTTQKFTGAAGGPVTSLTPVIEAPQQSEDQSPAANVDTPAEEIEADAAQESDRIEPAQASEASATPVPTPVRIVDEITATVEPEQVPGAGADSIDTMHSSPAIDLLGSGYENNGPDDGQPESSNVDDLDDGLVDKEESNDNDSDSDSGRSESSHDHESNDDDDDKDDDD